jgi:hypothetical protein
VARRATEAGDALMDRPICAIVMPRSVIDGCSEAHWAEVREIVRTAAESAGFAADLVGMAHQAGTLEQRIVQNRDDLSIAVCDVSGKDPDVMFELGLRLALDKATIIIKDDRTHYLFDMDAIEYLEYPRDLHKPEIAAFQAKLAHSMQSAYRNAASYHRDTTSPERFVAPVPARIEERGGDEFLIGHRRVRSGRN